MRTGRAVSAILAAGLATLLGGCQQDNGPRPPEPVTQIDHVDLFVGPTALNMDGAPGPDGTEATVFLYRRSAPQTQLVTGSIDILLYEHEGRTDERVISELLARRPDHIWSFPPALLARRRIRRMGLWGYEFRLDWGDDVPSTRRVVLLARYTPDQARPVYSTASIVTIKPD